MALTAGTLLRLFRVWQKNGEVPSAFRLNYAKRSPAITAPVMIRFIEFSARQQFSVHEIRLAEVLGTRREFWMRAAFKQTVQNSYGMARYYFPAANFTNCKSSWKRLTRRKIHLPGSGWIFRLKSSPFCRSVRRAGA